MAASLGACKSTTTGYKVPASANGAVASQYGSTRNTTCSAEGKLDTTAINSMRTNNVSSLNSNLNMQTNQYTSFISTVADTTTTRNNTFVKTDQTVQISNNIDVNLNLSYTAESITDTTLNFTGMDITNNFSYNMKTGAVGVGTKVIQDSAQHSKTKSNSSITSSSTLGYTSSVTQKLSNWSKFKSIMTETWGQGGVIVFFLIILIPIIAAVIWRQYCRNRTLCPSFFCRIWKWNLRKLGVGSREIEYSRQLDDCVERLSNDDLKDTSDTNNAGALVLNFYGMCENEPNCKDIVTKYLEKKINSEPSEDKWKIMMEAWNKKKGSIVVI